MRTATICLTTTILAVGVCYSADEAAKTKLKRSKLGSTRQVHAFGPTLLCGQPKPDDFRLAKERGIQVVITLREKGEVRWDQPALMKELDLEFHRLGFRAPAALTDEVFDKARKLLANSKKRPVMLQCGSANRVGAVWMAHRVLDHGIGLEEAAKEAKTVGLRTPAYEARAKAYIAKKQAKKE